LKTHRTELIGQAAVRADEGGRGRSSHCQKRSGRRRAEQWESGSWGNAPMTAGKKVGRAVLCPPRRARSARPTTHDRRIASWESGVGVGTRAHLAFRVSSLNRNLDLNHALLRLLDKAALARPHSKTYRHTVRPPEREASWSAECQFRFAVTQALSPNLKNSVPHAPETATQESHSRPSGKRRRSITCP